MRELARRLDASKSGGAVTDTFSGLPRLLAVDDDNLHRMIICRAAARAGYAPAGAATLDEVTELLKAAAFDCVTLDLSFGAHGGVEILHHIHRAGCKAEIIVISGCDAAACEETIAAAKSLDLHVFASIPKPVDLALLRQGLEQLKSERAAAPVAAA